MLVVVVFISFKFRSVECFLHTRHVAVHFELVFHIYLLVQHFLVVFHVLLFGKVLILTHLSIVGCLKPGLVLIELILVIHFGNETLFFLLHLQLQVIQLLGLIFLGVNVVLFSVEPSLDFCIVFCFPFLLGH